MKQIKKGGRQNRRNNSNTQVNVSKLIEERKKFSDKEKRLRNMTWAMGLEHEAQYFYYPYEDLHTIYPLYEAVVFNCLEPHIELANDPNTQEDIKIFLSKMAKYEETGRKCHNTLVLDKIWYNDEPLAMPEFVTTNPFSSLLENRNILSYYDELLHQEKIYHDTINKSKTVEKFLKMNNIQFGQYPFGMCSDIRVRKNYDGISPELSKAHYEDYTGSFHITITLPFEEKEKYTAKDEKDFADMHYNFGALFQWIEPLLLAAYFSTDQRAMGTDEKRIRGSFRVARVAWGNLAGSDMRNPDKGIGRYAVIKPYWREGFKFHESEILKSCEYPHKQEPKSLSSFSSNIRTFGPDPQNPKERISGAKMTIPNGLEFRIFDHFPTEDLFSLMQIMILIAANSRRVKVTDFVYEDNDWIEAVQSIMLNGWRTEVSIIFIKKLEKIFDLKIAQKTEMAWDVLDALVKALYEKNKDSDIMFLLYNGGIPKIPMINKYSWDFAFLLRLLKDDKIYEAFLKLLSDMIDETSIYKIRDSVVKRFGPKWKNNWLDILYFLSGKKLIKINDDKYTINPEFIKSFATRNGIKTEIIITYNVKKLFSLKQFKHYHGLEKNYFSIKNIKERFKDYITE